MKFISALIEAKTFTEFDEASNSCQNYIVYFNMSGNLNSLNVES